jgi:poly-gamma-glutamate capsule biosynthesis protein CapA/YwtB (metallophosphatase superfamily)
LSHRVLGLALVCLVAGGNVLFAESPLADSTARIVFFGDVNLGRAVGQEILKGNRDYPFQFVKDSLVTADAVFVNLESQLSEQSGETQHPKNNLIFTGPPDGGRALRSSHIAVVSTANNHAFDYGERGLRETILNLDTAGIRHVGTSADSVGSTKPVVLEVAGIRIGFLAYTQFMNFKGAWVGHVALFERRRVAEEIALLRPNVDVVVVSYHGGEEYVDRPPGKVRGDFRFIAESGADVVVGHHPHYVQGVEWYGKTLMFYSLGNFVFYQPQRQWTQLGLGVEITFARHDSIVSSDRVRLRAVRAGLTPSLNLSKSEEQTFFQRLQNLSAVQLRNKNGVWLVESKNRQD